LRDYYPDIHYSIFNFFFFFFFFFFFYFFFLFCNVERIPDEYIDIYLPSHCSGQMLVTGESKYEKASFQYRDFLDETYESFLNYCIGKLGISRPEAQQ